jgi:hypothetical protein
MASFHGNSCGNIHPQTGSNINKWPNITWLCIEKTALAHCVPVNFDCNQANSQRGSNWPRNGQALQEGLQWDGQMLGWDSEVRNCPTGYIPRPRHSRVATNTPLTPSTPIWAGNCGQVIGAIVFLFGHQWWNNIYIYTLHYIHYIHYITYITLHILH